ncbi:MAG: hipA [Rhizobacter sp.]|nr:hipA [Rhizobacter sp.]
MIGPRTTPIAALGIWMNGERVGVWSRTRGARVHTLTYARSWVDSPRVRPLSLSLPIPPSREILGPAVENYFDNLLPDYDKIRERIHQRFTTASTSAFDLLTAIGRDCVGAVQLLPEADEPAGFDTIESEPLDNAQIESILQGVTVVSGLGHRTDASDFRISIAGAQEKTALLRLNGRWRRPIGATPTTHILKLPLGMVGGMARLDLRQSVENEWLCSRIVDALGLPAAACEMAEFGAQRVLVVERFDRAFTDRRRWIARLPQEDMCQATATPPGQKYEADGGPGMKRILDLLSVSESPVEDRSRFLRSQLAFWLLAGIDGHAKNFSIFLKGGDRFSLTPLYDVLSAWPLIGRGRNKLALQDAKLAMAVRGKNAHWRLGEILARHWQGLALRHGGEALWAEMLALVAGVDAALDVVAAGLPERFPHDLYDSVAAGMRRQAATFLKQV